MFAALSPFQKFYFRKNFTIHPKKTRTDTHSTIMLSFTSILQDCPESELDFRQQQCSHFDTVPFEGVRYTWVPYTKAPNPCELNCMPKGERFYYRHKAKVIDGTPCNDESLDVCVNGECQVRDKQ